MIVKLACGTVFHSVCPVWLSSAAPEYFTFSYCAWLWNWLITCLTNYCVAHCLQTWWSLWWPVWWSSWWLQTQRWWWQTQACHWVWVTWLLWVLLLEHLVFMCSGVIPELIFMFSFPLFFLHLVEWFSPRLNPLTPEFVLWNCKRFHVHREKIPIRFPLQPEPRNRLIINSWPHLSVLHLFLSFVFVLLRDVNGLFLCRPKKCL